MARIDNLDSGELRDLLRRVRALEKATPLNNASIGRNGLRVHDGGVITIENGGLKITGTAEVIGELIGSGVLTWTGETNLEGPTTITGTLGVDGNTDINGALGINGPTTLTGDLSLAGGGQINIGSAVVLKGGVISGATVQIVGTSVIILSGDSQVLGTLLVSSAATVGSLVVQGSATLSSLPIVSGVTPNLYVDPSTHVLKEIV